jgi:D-alanyl-D-alanine dipeptidase
MKLAMPHDYSGRLARAQAGCRRSGFQALIVSPSSDLLYLAGYGAPVLERLTALVVPSTGDPLLVVPELERPRAAAAPVGGLMEFRVWKDGEDPFEAIRNVLPSSGTVGVTDQMFALHLLGLQRVASSLDFVSASTVIAPLRLLKDPGEVELLARAASSADESFRRICSDGLEGRRERDVARALRDHLVDTGHEEAMFWTVGSGPNGASPHHDSGEKGIQRGDVVVLDFGGRLGGYGSDITRTVAVGEPETEVKEVHSIVREAQEQAFLAVHPGVECQEIDRVARGIIAHAGYRDAFIHRTGHGIGLDGHEDPYIVEGNDQVLEPGMCFSIEPGVYLPGRFGVRIEDIVTVTADGGQRLNEAPRDLAVVD